MSGTGYELHIFGVTLQENLLKVIQISSYLLPFN